MEGNNIYYNPEKFGLTVVHETDLGGSYEFDKLVIWRREDGSLVMGTDAGCSCPIPFEDQGPGDLEPATESAIRAWFDGHRFSESRDVHDLSMALSALEAKAGPAHG